MHTIVLTFCPPLPLNALEIAAFVEVAAIMKNALDLTLKKQNNKITEELKELLLRL